MGRPRLITPCKATRIPRLTDFTSLHTTQYHSRSPHVFAVFNDLYPAPRFGRPWDQGGRPCLRDRPLRGFSRASGWPSTVITSQEVDCRHPDKLGFSMCYLRFFRGMSCTLDENVYLYWHYTYPQATFTEEGVAKQFHVSHEVTILSISLFVEGLGLGPLLVGPLSEVYGRNIVYRVSYALFFIFSWPVAFAPNIGEYIACLSLWLSSLCDTAVFLVFRFVTGFCGSAFLSVAGGSVSDLFSNATVAKWELPAFFHLVSDILMRTNLVPWRCTRSLRSLGPLSAL